MIYDKAMITKLRGSFATSEGDPRLVRETYYLLRHCVTGTYDNLVAPLATSLMNGHKHRLVLGPQVSLFMLFFELMRRFLGLIYNMTTQKQRMHVKRPGITQFGHKQPNSNIMDLLLRHKRSIFIATDPSSLPTIF